MKKYLFIFMTSIICLLCSCNTDDSMSNYTTKELDTVVDNNLITAIKHYNDSIYYCKNTSTRGSNTKRKKGISKEKGYISELESKILSLFFDAINDNVDVPKDLSNITDYYLTLIKTSKLLTTEEKQRLHLCIVLAENSFNLWFEKDIPA